MKRRNDGTSASGPAGQRGAQGYIGPQGQFIGPQGRGGPQGFMGVQGYQGPVDPNMVTTLNVALNSPGNLVIWDGQKVVRDDNVGSTHLVFNTNPGPYVANNFTVLAAAGAYNIKDSGFNAGSFMPISGGTFTGNVNMAALTLSGTASNYLPRPFAFLNQRAYEYAIGLLANTDAKLLLDYNLAANKRVRDFTYTDLSGDLVFTGTTSAAEVKISFTCRASFPSENPDYGSYQQTWTIYKNGAALAYSVTKTAVAEIRAVPYLQYDLVAVGCITSLTNGDTFSVYLKNTYADTFYITGMQLYATLQ